MTDFRFSDDAEEFRDEVRAWLATIPATEYAAHSDPADLTGLDLEIERRLQREAGSRGWLSMSLERQAVFNFEAAYADAPLIDTAMTLAGTALSRFGTGDHHRDLLARMERGETTFCAAYTEPGAGSDLTRIATTATRTDAGWRIDGVKNLVTNGHKADWCVMIARTDPDAAPRRAMTMFCIDMRASGVRVDRPATMNGWTLDELTFAGVEVDDSTVLGTVGEGWPQMARALAAERSGMFWLGFARHALDLLLDHVVTPFQGVVLADDPLVLNEIGRLEAEWSAADRMARRALWSQLTEEDPSSAPAMAKIVATEVLLSIAQSATELCGSAGLVWSPLFASAPPPGAAADGRLAWEYLERIHATIGGGANEVHRDAIAHGIFGRGRG